MLPLTASSLVPKGSNLFKLDSSKYNLLAWHNNGHQILSQYNSIFKPLFNKFMEKLKQHFIFYCRFELFVPHVCSMITGVFTINFFASSDQLLAVDLVRILVADTN